jgi:predicted nucleic acid-binding protein
MNGNNLLVDTNILIYFLQNDLEIIAATASYLQMPLLTADKGFRLVDDIDVIIYESTP